MSRAANASVRVAVSSTIGHTPSERNRSTLHGVLSPALSGGARAGCAGTIAMAFTQSRLVDVLPATSFLEHAFLRYALSPALTIGAQRQVAAQYPVVCGPHTYKLDYALLGARLRIAIELDGYAFHA